MPTESSLFAEVEEVEQLVRLSLKNQDALSQSQELISQRLTAIHNTLNEVLAIVRPPAATKLVLTLGDPISQ